MNKLEFKNVSKKYPYIKQFLFSDVSFGVQVGQRVGIVAEKQCGKSSVVKMLADITKPTQGQILLDGKDIYTVLPQDRGIGIIFDDFALIKGKSVVKNVAFPLKVRKVPNHQQIALRQVQKFGLDQVAKTKAKKLSPLQKLQTALARLDSRDDICLVVFDDPFAHVSKDDAQKYVDLFLTGRNLAILQTASDVDHLCDCDVVYVVADGTVSFCGTFAQAKEYISTTNCFDKFGINEDIQKVLQKD